MTGQLGLSRRALAAQALTRAVLEPGADTGRLDELVRATAAATDSATAHISMMTDQQITASVQGAFAAAVHRGDKTPFEDTICANALRCGTTLVISDATDDERTAGLAVVAAGAIGSYLGVPLYTGDGEMVGVLCVFDDHPRDWTLRHVADVSCIAVDIVAELHRLRAPR